MAKCSKCNKAQLGLTKSLCKDCNSVISNANNSNIDDAINNDGNNNDSTDILDGIDLNAVVIDLAIKDLVIIIKLIRGANHSKKSYTLQKRSQKSRKSQKILENLVNLKKIL